MDPKQLANLDQAIAMMRDTTVLMIASFYRKMLDETQDRDVALELTKQFQMSVLALGMAAMKQVDKGDSDA